MWRPTMAPDRVVHWDESTDDGFTPLCGATPRHDDWFTRYPQNVTCAGCRRSMTEEGAA